MSKPTTNFATRASVAIALSLAGMLTMATPALALTNTLAEQTEPSEQTCIEVSPTEITVYADPACDGTVILSIDRHGAVVGSEPANAGVCVHVNPDTLRVGVDPNCDTGGYAPAR